MSSHGTVETARLRKNLEDQLHRLVQELHDLENYREVLTDDEYEKAKAEIVEELQEFNESLQRMISGNMTLVNELGAMRLIIQSTVSAAFKIPESIKMFAERDTAELKDKLSTIERDFKLGQLTREARDRQRAEILSVLKHLGEKLEPAEIEFLEKLSLSDVTDGTFVPVNNGSEKAEIALAIASQEVRDTQDKK